MKKIKRVNFKINNRHSKSKLILIMSILAVFALGFLTSALTRGTGPLSNFFSTKPSINTVGACVPKTICTRKLDGRKDCTSYDCEITNGIKTTTTKSEIISDTAGTDKVVEYKYEVKTVVPVNSSGVPTGNSTTTEVRKKVKEDKEEVLSTVTTVQKPSVLDSKGLPAGPGEVVSDVRTGDITLGVTPYKSGDLDKKKACEEGVGGKETGKIWKDNSCQDQDLRTPQEKCTTTTNGQSSGNNWNNGACVMKVAPPAVTPASTVSTGINCDKGMCGTNGSPVCYGSYVMTGAGFAEGKQSRLPNSGDRECTLCGDDGKGGVGYTGSSDSCKDLLAKGAPVVIGYDVDPASLGLPPGTSTGACFSKRGGDWIQSPVGSPGEGPNNGKVCNVSGGWSDPAILPPTVVPPGQPVIPTVIVLTPAATCHTQHPGYIFGKNFEGKDVCLPNTASNQAMFSKADPCKPGKGILGGKDVYIECSISGAVKSYSFCSTSKGFDDKGNCQIDAVTPGQPAVPANGKLKLGDTCIDTWGGNGCKEACPGGSFSPGVGGTKCGTPQEIAKTQGEPVGKLKIGDSCLDTRGSNGCEVVCPGGTFSPGIGGTRCGTPDDIEKAGSVQTDAEKKILDAINPTGPWETIVNAVGQIGNLFNFKPVGDAVVQDINNPNTVAAKLLEDSCKETSECATNLFCEKRAFAIDRCTEVSKREIKSKDECYTYGVGKAQLCGNCPTGYILDESLTTYSKYRCN